MAEYILLKKHLKLMVDHLKEIHVDLQRNLSDFVQQVESQTKESMDLPNESNITFKEALALITNANFILLEETRMLVEFSIKQPYTQTLEYHGVEPTDDSNAKKSENKINQQEHYRKMNTGQDRMTKDIEILNKRMKQQEKRLEANNETIDELKSLSANQSREIDELKKELSKLTNCVYYLEKQIDSLTTVVYETGTSIHDLDTKHSNRNIMELVEKTREDFRNLEAKQTKACDHFRKTCSALENKIAGQSKSFNGKFGVVCQILSTRILPLESLADVFKKSFTKSGSGLKQMENYSENLRIIATKVKLNSIEEKLKKTIEDVRKIEVQNVLSSEICKKLNSTLENKLTEQSNDFMSKQQEMLTKFASLDNTVNHRYTCQIYFKDKTSTKTGSALSSFGAVIQYNGQHFNKDSGKFLSPEDGLYLVCVTLHQDVNKTIQVAVLVRDVNNHTFLKKRICVRSSNTSVGTALVVDMVKDDELFLAVDKADNGAVLSSRSHVSIVAL